MTDPGRRREEVTWVFMHHVLLYVRHQLPYISLRHRTYTHIHSPSRWCLHNENTFSSLASCFSLPTTSDTRFHMRLNYATCCVCHTKFTYVCLRWDTFKFSLPSRTFLAFSSSLSSSLKVEEACQISIFRKAVGKCFPSLRSKIYILHSTNANVDMNPCLRLLLHNAAVIWSKNVNLRTMNF